jgi:hypothetical protein
MAGKHMGEYDPNHWAERSEAKAAIHDWQRYNSMIPTGRHRKEGEAN